MKFMAFVERRYISEIKFNACHRTRNPLQHNTSSATHPYDKMHVLTANGIRLSSNFRRLNIFFQT